MPSNRRRERVSEMMEETLSVLLSQAADERLQFVTVTDVEVNQDLSAAKVWITVDGDDEECEEALNALDHAKGFIRREIAQALDLRRAPTLTFHHDPSIARAARVMELFKQLEAETQRQAKSTDDPHA